MDERILELATRRRIYEFILHHPGCYLREIQRGVAMTMGALEYHLAQLERAGLARVEHRENKYYFVTAVPEADASVLGILRQAIGRRIVLALLASAPQSHQELMAAAQVRSSTLTYHANKLAAAGLLERARSGRESQYRLVDPERTMRLLVEYRASFLDRVLDAFLEGFEELGPE